jgi:hypothetical protein
MMLHGQWVDYNVNLGDVFSPDGRDISRPYKGKSSISRILSITDVRIITFILTLAYNATSQMPTKKFIWKDRDQAALDLVQLAYHAPLLISRTALSILGSIRSGIIIPDLQAITLDGERDYWERIYALRALAHTPGDILFPELDRVVERDLSIRLDRIARANTDPGQAHSDDMSSEIVAFAALHPINRQWLLQRFDQSDPLVVSLLLVEQLSYAMPEDMRIGLLHRLIALLETYPNLITPFAIHQIYDCGADDENAKAFLQAYFDVIVEKCLSANAASLPQRELPWTIPMEWPELRAALFQRRPDFEENYRRDEMKREAERNQRAENQRKAVPYQETAVWRELEALYEQAGSNSKIRKLYHKAYDEHLSIPVRAAAAYFLGQLRDQPDVHQLLDQLMKRPTDTWEHIFSPVRYEAGSAIFQMGTPEAWESLVTACFVSPTNVLLDALLDWIERLTDSLSGNPIPSEHVVSDVAKRWRNAL